MSYQPRTLFRLLEDIDRTLFLPHIQRPFVWNKEQMQRLFDSLMRDYPIQTFLFWRTQDEIKARRFMNPLEWDPILSEHYDERASERGVEKRFVLDGQQRLQTLYTIFRGCIEGKPKLHAYARITDGAQADEEGILYHLTFAPEPTEPADYCLSDLLGKDKDVEPVDLALRLNGALDAALEESAEERSARHGRVLKNVLRLRSLLYEEKHFWAEELDGVAKAFPYERVLDIFVRVNSGGTKLSAGDLMFAAMKRGWDDMEERIDEVVEMLNETRLAFDSDVVLKSLVVAQGSGAELTPEKLRSDELIRAIEASWDHAEATFQQLRDFIKNELQLYGDQVVRSYGAFVPLFDFVYHNPKPNEVQRRLMRAYYYKAQLFNWFGAGTDKVINAVHGIVGKNLGGTFPLDSIKTYFASNGRAVELKKDQLLESRVRMILLNIVYVDQFTSSPFDVRFKGNAPHIDHIYPQSKLRKDLGYGTPDVNHLGNYRFIGATDNIKKRAEKPADYFARMKQGGIPIEKHLLVPEYAAAPSKLEMSRKAYEDFRDRRLDCIYEILKAHIDPETATAS